MEKHECGNCGVEMDYEENFCVKCENEGYHYCEKCEKAINHSKELWIDGSFRGLVCDDCYNKRS